MGFYIHSCPKMRYKGDFHPSELLCPTTLRWYDLSVCKPILDIHKFSPFEPALVEQRSVLGVPPVDSDLTGQSYESQMQYYKEQLELLFSPNSSDKNANLCLCPLNIRGRTIKFDSLRSEYQTVLYPVLSLWITLCGKENASRFNIKLS